METIRYDLYTKLPVKLLQKAEQMNPILEVMTPQEGWNFYPAFTVAELGEMLPFNIITTFISTSDEEKWRCRLDNTEIEFKSKTEADARAKMLIYLLENNLLK